MSSIITPSENVKKGILIINRLDPGKFPLLLSRILKSLHSKDEKGFSETEEIKLQTSLNLSTEEIGLLLATLHYIFEQAVYYLAKPSSLSQQLLEIGTDENKVTDIIQAWTSNAKGLVEKLSQRSVVPEQLEEVNWRLHLKLSNSKKVKETAPSSIFEFGIKSNSAQSNGSFVAEFSHEELAVFYDQLETIQRQLDSIR